MSYPMRRYDPASDETASVRPRGPVLVEDEPTLETAPAGARTPPGRLPPGVFGTDFEPTPAPSPRPGPVPRPLTPVGHYLSFLPVTVLAVYLVLLVISIWGFMAIGGWVP